MSGSQTKQPHIIVPCSRYQHNPWRAPGNAPIYDACGMAGGSPSWTKTQLSFVNTSNAKQGDLGSEVLPRAPTGVVWTAGSEVEAKWSLRANHGGGGAMQGPGRGSAYSAEHLGGVFSACR